MGATPAINRSYGRRRKSLRTQMEEENAMKMRGQHQTFSKTPGINRSYGRRSLNKDADKGSSFFGVSKTLDFGMDDDSQNQATSITTNLLIKSTHSNQRWNHLQQTHL